MPRSEAKKGKYYLILHSPFVNRTILVENASIVYGP